MKFSEFSAMVRGYLIGYNRRLGIQNLIDQLIRSGCIDLQAGVKEYRQGHVSEFVAGDLTLDGFASLGPLPNGVVNRAYMVWKDSESGALDEGEILPLKEVSWSYWQNIRGGTVDSDQGMIALDSRSSLFLVTPAVDDTMILRLEWTGTKMDYKPADLVRYDDVAAQAVSEYVLARLTRLTDKKNLTLAASHEKTYIQLKRRIRADSRLKGSLVDVTP